MKIVNTIMNKWVHKICEYDMAEVDPVDGFLNNDIRLYEALRRVNRADVSANIVAKDEARDVWNTTTHQQKLGIMYSSKTYQGFIMLKAVIVAVAAVLFTALFTVGVAVLTV